MSARAAARGWRSLGTLPIRWRLTLFYAALAASILLLLGLLLYRELDAFLVENTAARLRAQAAPVLERRFNNIIFLRAPGVSLAPAPSAPTGEMVVVPAPGALGGVIRDITLDLEETIRELTTSDTSALVLGPEGEIIAGGPAAPAPPDPPLPPGTAGFPAGAAARAVRLAPLAGAVPPPPNGDRIESVLRLGREESYIVDHPDGPGRTLVALTPLRYGSAGDVIGVLQLATSLEAADDLLARLRILLLLGLGAAFGLSVLVGVPLTRAALRPLDRLVATTEQIAADDLAARSRLPHGEDEIGRLAAAFDRMLARLQASFEAQRRFVADAAHELRTPLTAISGLIELLLLGADNEDRQSRRRTLITVDKDLARLTRLVNDLLSLSRHDLAAPHERQPIDLIQLVSEVRALTAELAPDRTVTLERPAAPVIVRGDPDHLRQVLLNLAENARRHTPPGGRITFRLRRGRRTAEVVVSDTGPGIAPEDLRRVFECFYRGGDRARARSSGGSGLGLSIARAIAEAHGGTLEAASPPNEGATFTLRLPLATGAGDQAPSNPSASSSNL